MTDPAMIGVVLRYDALPRGTHPQLLKCPGKQLLLLLLQRNKIGEHGPIGLLIITGSHALHLALQLGNLIAYLLFLQSGHGAIPIRFHALAL